MSVVEYLKRAAMKKQETAADPTLESKMERAVAAVVTALSAKQPFLVCGNGGSASDAMHIAGELVGRFLKERPGLNVICLSSNPAVLTAWANDYDYESVFSRQVEAYGQNGGVFLGISTSGNSKNVIKALEQARAMNLTTIGLTGQGGGKMAPHCDILLDVPSRHTPEIQEIHLCLYHYLCENIESRMVALG